MHLENYQSPLLPIVSFRQAKSLIQIALDCGFEDQSYFSRVFKRYTGLSPRAYRETAPKSQILAQD